LKISRNAREMKTARNNIATAILFNDSTILQKMFFMSFLRLLIGFYLSSLSAFIPKGLIADC